MTLRGQASHKPQGRKPRHAPMPFGEAKPLWGFDGSQSGRMLQTEVRREGDIARMSDVRDAGPESWMTQRTRDDVTAA